MKKTRRVYSKSDSYMLESSSVMQVMFTDDIGDFMALDSSLNAAFALAWLAKIHAAYSAETYHSTKSILKQKTKAVDLQMEACRIKYGEVKFFARKAFRHSKVIQAEFGTATYSKASINKVEMIAFMDGLHNVCLKYQAELMLAGLTQTDIDDVALLGEKLLELSSVQENARRALPVQTQKRIETLNTCYQDTKLIMDAASIVYRNDFARRKAFVYGG